MEFFKLNFYRFGEKIEIADLEVGVGINDSGLRSTAQKVVSTYGDVEKATEKLIEANEKLATSSTSARTGLKTINENNVRRFNASLGVLKTQMQSPFASDKIKVTGSSKLAQLKNMGMDNMLIKNAGDLTSTQSNRVLSQTNQINNMTSRETVYQQKELAKATKEAIAVLEKQYPVTDKLKLKLGELGSEAGKTADKTLTFSQRMSKAFDKLKHYAVSWRIVYGVFQSIWNTLSDTFEKAAAYQEALNLYRVAMGEYAKEADIWAERISTALYLDPKQIMQYTGALYNLVQGLGVSSDAAYTMSTNLTQLAYDMSSYLNIDVEAAYAKLQSAMTGQSRAVASAGIAMQQASLQELAFRLGIKKEVAEMTQAEKTYLRYIQIMRSTSNMQTDLARTIITPENAIRVIKQQFELLGRAIGNVFIPIVMKAIPYVMALTQILTELANRLANVFGFKLAEINYDYLNLREVDTAVEDTMDNVAASAGNAAKSIGSSINRTLAAFDELNVVESESGGGRYPGSGGLGGSDNDVLGNLEKYITGYDMLEGLNQDFTSQTETARKNLEKLETPLKVIGAIIAGYNSLKFVDWLLNVASGAKKAFTAGTGLAGVFKNLISKTANITKLIGGLVDKLGGLGGAAVTIAGFIYNFKTMFDIANNPQYTLEGQIEQVKELTVALGGFGSAAGALSGSLGVTVVAVGSYLGTVIGNIVSWKKALEVRDFVDNYIMEQDKLAREIKDREEAIANAFDNGGMSAQYFIDRLSSMSSPLGELAAKMQTLSEDVDASQLAVREAADAYKLLHEAIVAGTDDPDIIKKLKSANEQYKESVKENTKTQLLYHNTVLQNLKEEGVISQQEYERRIKNAKDLATKQSLYASEYADELLKLDTQLQNNDISQEEYNKSLEELRQKYLGLIPPSDDLYTHTSNLMGVMSRKIDFENFDEVKAKYDALNSTYNEGITAIETLRTSTNKYYDGLIGDAEYTIKQLKSNYSSLSDEQKTYLAELEVNLENYKKTRDEENAYLDTKNKELTTQFGNYLANFRVQLAQSGLDSQKEIKDTVKSMDKELQKLGDIDLTKAVDDSMGAYFKYLEETHQNLTPHAQQVMSEDLIGMSDAMWEKLNDKLPQYISGTTSTARERFNEAFGIINNDIWGNAKEAATKYKSGWEEGTQNLTSSITKIGENAIKSIQNSISNKPLSFNVNTNLTSSYNTILRGFQYFANNKWGPAVDNLMGNTSSVFGGLKLSGLTSLIVSKFKGINIKLYEGGGYPTSGDLFFANENGRAEYITSLGNRTAVANQDQMVSALTNAILQGMSAIETSRQPNHIVVNLGNEKLYEGQGTYQNRQADRYGTTYVQI